MWLLSFAWRNRNLKQKQKGERERERRRRANEKEAARGKTNVVPHCRASPFLQHMLV